MLEGRRLGGCSVFKVASVVLVKFDFVFLIVYKRDLS